MKKIALLFVAVVAGATLMTSCKSHEKCAAYQGAKINVVPPVEASVATTNVSAN